MLQVVARHADEWNTPGQGPQECANTGARLDEACVLVYDHRYLGDSEGEPRQRIRMAEQLQDRLAAIVFARTLDGVDPDRIIMWGYSLSGGTAIEAATADQRIAGAILLCPFTDGRWRCNRSLMTQPRNALWTLGQAIRDAMIPVSAGPGIAC